MTRRLASFPTAACELALSLLDLTDNNLAKLPPQLGRMTSLRALPLSGNPLRGLRTGQPLSSLLRSLRNCLEVVCPARLCMQHSQHHVLIKDSPMVTANPSSIMLPECTRVQYQY